MSLADKLVVKRGGGEVYGILFENERAGVERGLFLTVVVEFERIEVAGEEFRPQLMSEWLPWRDRDWRGLEGRVWEWTPGQGARFGEASFYTVEHDDVVESRIELRRRQGTSFEIDWRAVVDYPGYTGDDAEPRMAVRAVARGDFQGILISGEIVPGEPGREEEARAALAPFVDVDSFGGVELRRNEFGVVAWWLRA